MPNSERRALLSKPQIEKLKVLHNGLHVSHVMGDRVMVKVMTPKTEADRLEEEGTLVVPGWVKKANTPLPSVGVVVKLGEEVSPENAAKLQPGVGVMFSPYAGSDWALEHEDFKILETREVICTLLADDDFLLVPIKED